MTMIGLLKTIALIRKADKMTDKERCLLQHKRLKELVSSIIMTGGEKLSDDVRRHLSEVPGCYVRTNYSCTQGGTVACECTGRHFPINDDWVILEAVDENNQSVPFGTQSAKALHANL